VFHYYHEIGGKKMKRKVLLWIIIVWVAIAFGSRTAYADVDKGVKAGVNLSTFSISSDFVTDLQALPHFRVGAFVSFDVSKSIAIQPEFYYSMKGPKLIETIYGPDPGKWKLSYIEIPVLAKIKFIVRGNLKPGLLIGPYTAFNTGAKWIVEGLEDEDIKEYIKTIDYGIVLGGSVDIKMNNCKLILDVRYNIGLINIGEKEYEEYNTKNRSFSFMVGIAF
jgi:hypothetical protein